MSESNPTKQRASGRRKAAGHLTNLLNRAAWVAALAAAVFVCAVLVFLAWNIGGRPVDGTATLIEQAGLMVATFNACLGLAVAASTIYYAIRTRDMVEITRSQLDASRADRIDAAIGNLVGASFQVVANSSTVAELMPRRAKRLALGLNRTRGDVMLQAAVRSADGLNAVARWSEEIRFLSPVLGDAAWNVSQVAIDAHDAGTRGDGAAVTNAATALYDSLEALRQMRSA